MRNPLARFLRPVSGKIVSPAAPLQDTDATLSLFDLIGTPAQDIRAPDSLLDLGQKTDPVTTKLSIARTESPQAVPPPPANAQASKPEIVYAKLTLRAHVSDIGDSDPDFEGWVGDFQAAHRIEGFVLDSNVAGWPDLCTCQPIYQDGAPGPATRGGSFCGTHGQNRALHGFLLTLSPDDRYFQNLRYEGRFQDGFQSPLLRAGEFCKSPTNAPLVAMRVHAREATQPALPQVAQHAPKLPPQHDPEADPDPGLAALASRHNGVHFLTPLDLSRGPAPLRRVALVGSCFLQAWNLQGRNARSCGFDVFNLNHAAKLPEKPSPDREASDYDFQIVQIAMRSFFHDSMLRQIPYGDIAAHESALEQAAERMAFQLSCAMAWNLAHGLLTFVVNFPVPQRNPLGILYPRFDIRNAEHFIYLLNQKLEILVRSYRNAYILDADRIAASFGRRYIQDDIISTIAHSSTLERRGADWARIEPMAPMAKHYEITWPAFFADAIWAEALCMYRVIRQDDSVKLVIVDLDDTLWRGVSGDMEDVDGEMVAGWPEGFAEALVYLKKRGILLAIVSKNEEARIRAIWQRIFGIKLSIADFSTIRINWRPKAENVAEILSLVNLLPRNVVFIDDNPAERMAVQASFPDIRVLGRNPLYFRRILLWSSETQNAAISAESERRTEMVQAQIVREEKRGALSREAFLATASPSVEIGWLSAIEDRRFSRALELINKTNQFNTTGKRWTAEEMRAFLSSGGLVLVFDVTDAFTAYGLVGVVLLRERSIDQWVMSCRILGLDIEIAVMEQVVEWARARGPGDVKGVLVSTDANFPCRDLFQKCGFMSDGLSWVLSATATLPKAPHVSITSPERTPTTT